MVSTTEQSEALRQGTVCMNLQNTLRRDAESLSRGHDSQHAQLETGPPARTDGAHEDVVAHHLPVTIESTLLIDKKTWMQVPK